MRKWLKRISIVIVIILFSVVCFSGCSKDYTLKRIAKALNNYTINLSLNTSDMTAACQEKVEYTNRSNSIIDYLIFHLYPTAFSEDATVKPYSSLSEARCFPRGKSYGDIEILEVFENGEKADWEITGSDNDKLQINLKTELDIQDKVTIDVSFNLVIPNCTHRFGYYENNINLTNFYPILSVYKNGEYDMTPYYSTGDPFYSECSNYLFTLSAPSEYQVFTSGTEKVESVSSGIKETTYEAKAVRDFGVVLGTNFEVRSEVVDNTKVNYIGYKGDENINNCLNLSVDAVKWISENLREYPYHELNVIKTPFVHGGMEYPGLVLISDTIEEEEELKKVIVHEIAHEWWYGLVGVNESNFAWIDEGLSEYTTALFFGAMPNYNISYESIINDAVASYTLYVDVISSINGKINTKMNLRVNEYVNEYEYTYMIYIKGVIMFDELAGNVGENKLKNALSKITKEYAFKNITEDEFTEAIKKYTHVDTDNFFKGFLDGNVIIGKLH